jgi:hypothetical protein
MATPVAPEPKLPFTQVHGIDFSGARLAGHALWWATLVQTQTRWHLTRLTSLAELLGTAQRDAVLDHLRESIHASEAALWALDFSFAVPAILCDESSTWRDWLAAVVAWPGDAPSLGRHWAELARERTGRSQVLRQTERDNGTQLTAYHSRLIYQTVFGVRALLAPLACEPRTAILPFDYGRLAQARRVLVEALPAATLRRAGWPDHGYKGSSPDTIARRSVRECLLGHLEQQVTIDPSQRDLMLTNAGGDALDALVAAWGAISAWQRVDHAAVAEDPLYQREGYEYT